MEIESEYPEALQKNTRVQHYLIKRVLGVGGFGITYLAEDESLKCLVAIKEFMRRDSVVRMKDNSIRLRSQVKSSDFEWGMERFLREARTLAGFKHPNIIRVNNFFKENGTAYMVMDYEEGETLEEFISLKGKESFLKMRFSISPFLF